MHRGLLRSRRIFVATLTVIVVATTTALAAQPATGRFHWQVCSSAPGGPCPVATIDFKVQKKKGHPAAITGFDYYSGFTCGDVPIGPPIKINSKGSFSFSGKSKSRKIPITVSGKFVSPKKAVGTLVIHASCQTPTPVKFTAKHAK